MSGNSPFCNEHTADLSAYEYRIAKQRAHTKRHKREYKATVRAVHDESKKRDGFYHSREWKHIRLSVLERDNYVCQYCYLFVVLRPATTVYHILPGQIAPELIRDTSNLAVICRGCHSRKTDWEHKFYHTGYKKNNQKIQKEIL
ncbi:hypothetical protein ATN92_11065 [Companilactobacillus bobalius]|nr:hypothetical protein ATN92_11065 [Companilactobacillus bobalius]